MPRYLPREGLTLEVIFDLIDHTALQPLITGPMLLGLLYYPEHIQSVLPANARRYVASAALVSTVKFLLGCGLVRKFNNYLSRIVLNNFTSDAWNFGKEIVVVTGGSNGMGAAIAREIAKTSVSVITLDLYPPTQPFPSNVHYYKADVTKSAEISAVAKVIREEHGDPTILVNNAGIAVSRPLLSETEEQIRRVFDVNTISHFFMVKEFLPEMVKRNHGHIVTLASMSSYSVHAGNIDYACSKASALAFHEGLAQEIKSRYQAPKVRTTIVHPAYVRTPLLQESVDRPEFNHFLLEPETVAEAVVKQLHSGNGGHLILPVRYTIACALRSFPSWMQELARNSINKDLDFLGTQGKAKVAGMD